MVSVTGRDTMGVGAIGHDGGRGYIGLRFSAVVRRVNPSKWEGLNLVKVGPTLASD